MPGVRAVGMASVIALLGAFAPYAVSQDTVLTAPLDAPAVESARPDDVSGAAPAPTGLATSDAPSATPIIAAEDVAPIEVREIREAPAVKAGVDLTRQSANLWDRIRHGFSMPNLVNGEVVQRQQWYAARPAQVKILAERSRRYLFHIVEELEKRGMPTELALLPMVESAFNPMAYSRAHASGLWQFIPSTGRTYNLSQNWWYDGRRDIVASTTAALDYLQTIYEMHGDWHLALASYNWGENAVARAVDRNTRLGLPTDYTNLAMPEETRQYVPKLQALKNILMNPQAFGIDLDPIPNAPYFATVTLTRDIDLKLAARLAEMPIDEMIALNPAHNRPVVVTAQAPTLVIPADRLDRFLANLANHDAPLSSWRTVTAQRGERIDRIAATYGVPLDVLRSANGIRGNGRLAVDTPLLVPVAGARAEIPAGLFQASFVDTIPDRPAPAARAAKGKALPAAGPAHRATAAVKRAPAAAKAAAPRKVQVARRG
jgi:membrane-bound lytic murein transglycosylase D